MSLQQPRTGPLIISPQNTHPQYQSLFFTRFPAEIRLQVWELVFDETEIEIPHYDEFELPRCWFAIVQTCRLAYSETIDLLYSQTRFNNLELCHLKRIQRMIPPRRWTKIQFLHLHVLFEPWRRERGNRFYIWRSKMYGTEYWPAICETLETLPSLRELRLTIHDERHWFTAERLWWLQNVKASEVFEIRFPNPVSDDFEAMSSQGVPWQLVT
ncbi:hypothetical protein K505DRAFT_375050 [Melanomma pulvis-pyrius CBS 109.77]|uniref:DUF7730 domain-containing protein n=1 Tax=Melanomma pulvis-pyrius CBS 109.77 TaxID=1314802 RepID=A0A6A6XCF8_9PLEO|nr:hypothetical protein K505DRAFT_375050 [Melanomma pulvis-pyrius CBS 109.77]